MGQKGVSGTGEWNEVGGAVLVAELGSVFFPTEFTRVKEHAWGLSAGRTLCISPAVLLVRRCFIS